MKELRNYNNSTKTRKEALKDCLEKLKGEFYKNRVCPGCGNKLLPLDTVDNSGNNVFWIGCRKCFCIDWTGVEFDVLRTVSIDRYSSRSPRRFLYELKNINRDWDSIRQGCEDDIRSDRRWWKNFWDEKVCKCKKYKDWSFEKWFERLITLRTERKADKECDIFYIGQTQAMHNLKLEIAAAAKNGQAFLDNYRKLTNKNI